MPLREMVWEKICEESPKITNNNSYVLLDSNSKAQFFNNYQTYRDDFFNNYMEEINPRIELDRHKNAAVIVCAIVEAQVLKSNATNKKNELFIGNESLAVNVALSYMRESLQNQIRIAAENQGCKEIRLSKEEARFILDNPECFIYPLPVPFSCPKNKYSFVLARDIYYAKSRGTLFHVSLANNFFLIENYALEHYKLKYYKSRL